MEFAICKTGQAIKVAHFGPCKHRTVQPKPTGNNITKLINRQQLISTTELFLVA